jgi:hypothetical protein
MSVFFPDICDDNFQRLFSVVWSEMPKGEKALKGQRREWASQIQVNQVGRSDC